MYFKRFQISVIVSLSVLASLCVAKLTRLPANSIQTVAGDTIIIECSTENKDYPPSWSHTRVGSKQSNDVYLTMKIPGDERIHGRMVNEYHGRFSVLEDRTTGKYSLQVTGVQAVDAGRYTCTARGGLGQQASSELGVIESRVECESNATEVIGENICNQEPDLVQLSCSFRFTGNNLPMVNWVKTDQPSQILKTGEDAINDDSGKTVSKLFVRADADGLSGSSFMCIVSSPIDAIDSRLSCTTPVINVLKIANSTISRIVDTPEEVLCNPLPHIIETRWKWVKRELEGDETEIVGTGGRHLNLYKPEFMSGGTFVCIIECDIRGQPCPVEALTITYEPAEQKSVVSPSPSTLMVVLPVLGGVVLVGIAAVIVGAVVIHRKPDSRQSSHGAENQDVLNSSNQSSNVSYDGKTSSEAENVPLKESDRSDVTLDITDSSFVSGGYKDRLLRNQRSVDNAMARMRINAALQQNADNSTEAGDVAEGIRGSADESAKDE